MSGAPENASRPAKPAKRHRMKATPSAAASSQSSKHPGADAASEAAQSRGTKRSAASGASSVKRASPNPIKVGTMAQSELMRRDSSRSKDGTQIILK